MSSSTLYAPVTDDQGVVTSARALIRVFRTPDLDAALQSRWTAMRDALRAGDIPRAVAEISTRTRDDYDAAFRIIAARLPLIDTILTDISLRAVRNTRRSIRWVRTEGNMVTSFEVRFSVDVDGQLRIEAF